MKNKMLALSDHALSTSGVGTQSRHLFEGLIKKKNWTIRQFGAALKHTNYETTVVNEDLIIKPIDGFGNPDLLRVSLATENPDILFIFTDPRFFIWLFEMEDEVHQICPIAWWHVWDNDPRPAFNDLMYESTDLINCHSHHTYTRVSPVFPEKTNFIPHALPKEMFFQMDKEKIKSYKKTLLGDQNQNKFIAIWCNRNAKRKRPGDVLWSWKMFLEKLEKETGNRDALLIMHTDPEDQEGPNLFSNAEILGIKENVFFSRDRIGFEEMNILYNISDVCINISYAEGFGLSTLEAMQTGTPIVAIKTGGLTRQVVDHRDQTENGVALDVEFKTLVGSQSVPYIYEDYVSCETVSKAIFKIFSLDNDEKETLSKKVKSYAESEFDIQKTVDLWDSTMTDVIKNWKEKYKRWELIKI